MIPATPRTSTHDGCFSRIVFEFFHQIIECFVRRVFPDHNDTVIHAERSHPSDVIRLVIAVHLLGQPCRRGCACSDNQFLILITRGHHMGKRFPSAGAGHVDDLHATVDQIQFLHHLRCGNTAGKIPSATCTGRRKAFSARQLLAGQGGIDKIEKHQLYSV